MSEREIRMPSEAAFDWISDQLRRDGNFAATIANSSLYQECGRSADAFDAVAELVEPIVRTAVERALAEEWKKNLDAKEELIRRFRELQAEQGARHKRELECPICCGSVDDSGFRCACGGSNDIRQAFEYLHGEWGRLRSELAQTEARHRREVIEARREALQEAARAVCGDCGAGVQLLPQTAEWEYGHPDGEGYRYDCAAAPIHDLIAALEEGS